METVILMENDPTQSYTVTNQCTDKNGKHDDIENEGNEESEHLPTDASETNIEFFEDEISAENINPDSSQCKYKFILYVFIILYIFNTAPTHIDRPKHIFIK